MVRTLIEAGADVNARTNEYHINETPLYWAAEKGKADVVRILIEAGADVNACSDNEISGPLHWAAKKARRMWPGY